MHSQPIGSHARLGPAGLTTPTTASKLEAQFILTAEAALGSLGAEGKVFFENAGPFGYFSLVFFSWVCVGLSVSSLSFWVLGLEVVATSGHLLVASGLLRL